MKDRQKILLIDQHPEWLKFAQDVLSDEYAVVTLTSYDEAPSIEYEVESNEGFDLIFIGLELATNNLDMLKPLFKQWQFVVVFPVLQENETVRMLFKAGVYDCAPKPYEREGLLKLVANELAEAKLVNGEKTPSPQKTRQEIEKQLKIMLRLEN